MTSESVLYEHCGFFGFGKKTVERSSVCDAMIEPTDLSVACGSKTVYDSMTDRCEVDASVCGPNTTFDGTGCVATAPESTLTCGANTTAVDGVCVADTPKCGKDQILFNGQCVIPPHAQGHTGPGNPNKLKNPHPTPGKEDTVFFSNHTLQDCTDAAMTHLKNKPNGTNFRIGFRENNDKWWKTCALFIDNDKVMTPDDFRPRTRKGPMTTYFFTYDAESKSAVPRGS